MSTGSWLTTAPTATSSLFVGFGTYVRRGLGGGGVGDLRFRGSVAPNEGRRALLHVDPREGVWYGGSGDGPRERERGAEST